MEELIKQIVKEAVEEALGNIDFGKCGEYYPDIMDLKTAAKYLKVSTSWLYKNIDSVPHFELAGTKFLKQALQDMAMDKTGRRFNLR